jgi:pimeloyl-ACP methyl ester carboxylesterase
MAEVRSFKQKVNDMEFYCELRGSGPAVALIPSGEGDCGSFAKVADSLADEFTVFTLDMRGCSRTGRPPTWDPITPQILASDVAELVKALELAPVSFYGCSSGGQTILSLGADYPDIVRNLMPHEAALLSDAPSSNPDLPDGAEATGFLKATCEMLTEQTGSKDAAMATLLPMFVGDEAAWKDLGPEYHERVGKNGEVWIDLYLEPVSQRAYSAEELQKRPIVFSAGMISPAWLVECNLRTARRCNAEVVWFPPPCMHYPQVSHPDLLADHIRKYTRKYL